MRSFPRICQLNLIPPTGIIDVFIGLQIPNYIQKTEYQTKYLIRPFGDVFFVVKL